MIARRPATRGYSLVVVLMTLGLITVSILSLYAYLEGSARSTGEVAGKRRAFYVCDGMTRMVGRLVSDYSKTVLTPTAPAAEAYIHQRASDPPLSGNLAKIMPDGYQLVSFGVTRLERIGERVPVPNGPFDGMMARETDLSFSIKARSADGAHACQIDQTLALSELGLFQFAVFSALPQIALLPTVTSTPANYQFIVSGRTHANGDICLGAESGGYHGRLRDLSAAGRVLHSADAVCTQGKAHASNSYVYNGSGTVFAADDMDGVPAAGSWTMLIDSSDHVSEPTWPAFSEATWRGHVRDTAHGVSALVAPVAPSSQLAQHAESGATPQTGTLRFLIDPPSEYDTSADKRHRLAYLADLRIIDGVWFLRDLANPDNWPGLPIWSDHPGNTTDHVAAPFTAREVSPGPRQVPVGQADLRISRTWGGATPQRYSYYAYDEAAQALTRGGGGPVFDPAPVVSYGLLERIAGAPTTWRPAVVTPEDTTGPPDPPNKVGACGASCQLEGTCAPSTISTYPISVASTGMCGVGVKTVASLLALGTGGAFYDPLIAAGSVKDTVRPLSPINIDITALQAALADGGTGELGTYFAGGRRFNGIIWISSLWPEGWDGFGTEAKPAARPVISAAHRGAIPYPLCSDSRATQPFDLGALTPTPIPSCAALMTSPGAVGAEPIFAWPNVVRVINAAQLDRAILPKGLTVASNLPVWMIGDANATSDWALTATDAETDEAVPTDWLPFLVAGDVVALGSRNWTDAQFALKSNLTDVFDSDAVVATGAMPAADATTDWRLAVLSGMPFSVSATRQTDFKAGLRFPEDWWNAAPAGAAVLHGSVAFGYVPVYAGVYGGEPSTSLPFYLKAYPNDLRIVFDHRLSRIDTQPPGTVSFDIQSVRSWERR